MALTAHDVIRLRSAQGSLLEKLAVGTTAAYSGRVIPPGRLLKIVCDDGAIVKLCQEYVFGNRFGTDPDVRANELFDGNKPGETNDLLSQYWDVSNIVTTTPDLDKTAATITQSHVLVYTMTDQDDAISCPLFSGKRSRYGSETLFDKAQFKASKVLEFTLRHLDDDALELLQWGLKEYRHAATNPEKWWDGSAWQTTAQWIDVTGSATIVNFTDAITLDEGEAVIQDDTDGSFISGPSTYELHLRPKTNYAGGFSHISDVGVHETITATDADARMTLGAEYFFETKAWTRVGCIADNATKQLYISEMGV